LTNKTSVTPNKNKKLIKSNKMPVEYLPWEFSHHYMKLKPDFIATPCVNCDKNNTCFDCYDEASLVRHVSYHATFEDTAEACFQRTGVRINRDSLIMSDLGIFVIAGHYSGFSQDEPRVKLDRSWICIDNSDRVA